MRSRVRGFVKDHNSSVLGQKLGKRSSQRSKVGMPVGRGSKVRDPRSEVGLEVQSKVVS